MNREQMIKGVLKYGIEKDLESATALVDVYLWLQTQTNTELYDYARRTYVPKKALAEVGMTLAQFDSFQAFIEAWRLKTYGGKQ